MAGRRYKTERQAIDHQKVMARDQGIWSAVIRKVDVDGKRYYIISFDPDDWE